MEKKELNEKDMEFLSAELDYLKRKEIISSNLETDILNAYCVKEKISFLRVILIIGAVLLGIGIISFLAGNWRYINDFAKIIIIILIVTATNISALQLENKYSKTSRAFYYLGIIELGAGIFLIRDIFNTTDNSYQIFLYWAIGIISIVLITKDKVAGSFFSILTILYMVNFYGETQDYPFTGIVFLFINIWLTRKLLLDKPNFFLTIFNIIVLFSITVLRIFKDYDSGIALFFIALFLLGLTISSYGFKVSHKALLKNMGHTVHGIAGIGLSISETWNFLSYDLAISSVFSVLYFLYLLYLIKKENLISIIFSGAIILTLYVNLTYEYLSKSLLFIVSGAIFLGFGYYFEKKRKAGEQNELKQ